jgi:hypothetical protein
MFYITKEVLYVTGYIGVISYMARQNYIYNSRGWVGEKDVGIGLGMCCFFGWGLRGRVLFMCWRGTNYLYNCGKG